MKKRLLVLLALAGSLALSAQSRQSLLDAALKNSNASDSSFLLRDSVLAHLYYDAESDSMLLADLQREKSITPADAESMHKQLQNYSPHVWGKDSVDHAVVVSSKTLPANGLNPKKCLKAWTNYFTTHRTGFYEVSEPVFSVDGETAIVYIAFQCGAGCGNGGATLYHFEGGEWKPVKNLFSWQKGG